MTSKHQRTTIRFLIILVECTQIYQAQISSQLYPSTSDGSSLGHVVQTASTWTYNPQPYTSSSGGSSHGYASQTTSTWTNNPQPYTSSSGGSGYASQTASTWTYNPQPYTSSSGGSSHGYASQTASTWTYNPQPYTSSSGESSHGYASQTASTWTNNPQPYTSSSGGSSSGYASQTASTWTNNPKPYTSSSGGSSSGYASQTASTWTNNPQPYTSSSGGSSHGYVSQTASTWTSNQQPYTSSSGGSSHGYVIQPTSTQGNNQQLHTSTTSQGNAAQSSTTSMNNQLPYTSTMTGSTHESLAPSPSTSTSSQRLYSSTSERTITPSSSTWMSSKQAETTQTTTVATITTTAATTTTTAAATTTTAANTTEAALFTYGYNSGDWAMYGDDNLRRIYSSRGFPIGSGRGYELYISTNGYIVFERYYNIYRPRRFPTSNVQMVAPFWADATTYYYFHNYYYYYYSSYYWNLRYRARVYYGVYIDGKNRYGVNASDVFSRVNQLISSKKNVASFTARAIVIVTWYKMLPHFGNEMQTNTFQCVLATDYSRSFTIYLYENGGMLWPKTSYTHTPVIGYQMGQKQYYNSAYSKKLEAMRIDQIKGNTGVKGMWIFQLDDNRGTKRSYAAECLDWYEKQEDDLEYMREIDRRISDCPCTIWQAFFDRRFRYAWREYNYLEGNYCFYSTLSPWRWTGARKCCYQRHRIRWYWSWWWSGGGYWGWRYTYTLNNDPITGGSLLRYSPTSWRQRRRYNVYDREPYVNCCLLSGLCTYYREYRWTSRCSRYRAPRRSRFWGDPHITTLDGKGYTFNGWGEYVLLQVKSASTNELQLMIQGRTDRATNDEGNYTDATIFSAFAAKDYETNATMHVELTDDKKDQTVYCNKVDYTSRFQNRTTDFDVQDENLGCSRSDNNTLTVTFSSGISMNISNGVDMLEISVSVPQELSDNVTTRGLLGAFNSNQDDDFTMPNGTELYINSTEKEIFHGFGKLWLIEESVFQYRSGDDATKHSHGDFTPKFLEDYPPHLIVEAKAICDDNSECVFDYLSTNRTDVAESTKNTANETAEQNSVIGNAIPTLSADDTIQATIGETTYLTIDAEDHDNEDVTIYLVNNITGDSNLNQTGNRAILRWTPESLDPIVLSIAGSDESGAEAAPLLPTVLLCRGCSGHGTCDFNNTDVDLEQTNSNSTSFTVVTCDCDDGWIGDNCDEDFDGCADEPCPAGSNCTDLLPDEQASLNGTAFQCGGCPDGLELTDNKCMDIDECNATESVCDHICYNTEGSYSCGCNDGYNQEGFSTCTDIDECTQGTADCAHICVNTDGGYNCSCESGFLASDDGKTCQKDPNHNPCPGSGLNCSYACRKGNDDSPECFCQSGYQIDNTVNCVDIDECLSGRCTHICVNTEGSYTCSCYTGNKLKSDRITCEKCDSLHWGDDCSNACDCNENSDECHNVRGCVCKPGWEGADCDTDVDECLTVQCGSLKECLNIPGSYECNCMDGYTEVSGVCIDIDECEEDTHNCTFTCINGAGSYICKCSEGYTGDGVTCLDVDECTEQVPDCEHTCVNTEGGYNCDCYQGFKLKNDRKTCLDVDNLCSNASKSCDHICSINGTSVQCYCRPGYSQVNDTNCEDINECEGTNAPCSQMCTNSGGGYQCTCDDGYQLSNDKKTCEVCDEFHWGPKCANECSCGQGKEICNNTSGCICKDGWQGSKCDTDIRECNDSSKCAQEKLCVELLGSYRCDCPEGKEANGAGDCVDIDECSTSTHTCAQDCINTIGSYTCRCKPGFRNTNDGRLCEDINECDEGHLCEEKCTNTEGGYTCTCYTGQQLDVNKLNCINDPTTDACPGLDLSCSHACREANGQGSCYCPRDSILESDGKTCRAIRYRVKAKITLQLTFNSSLEVITSEYYKETIYNIQEALRRIYEHLPYFSSVLVTILRNGSVSAEHEAVFNQSISSPETTGVADSLKNAYSAGTLALADGNVVITTTPVLINSQNNEYSVTDPVSCAMTPCGFDEDCQDVNGAAQCYPTTTTTAATTTTTRGPIRLHVQAIIHLQLTFTEELSNTSSSGYKTMAANLTGALGVIYGAIANFQEVQILELSNGTITVNHNVVFTSAVSSSTTIAVATTLNNTYNLGYLTVNGVNVTITQVPVIVTIGGAWFLVSSPLNCNATPCGYDEDCSDANGFVVCTPKGSPEDNRLTLGLAIGLSLACLLVVVIIITVIGCKKLKTSSGRRRLSRVSDISIKASMKESFIKKDEFGSSASAGSFVASSSRRVSHPFGVDMWTDIPEVENRPASRTSVEARPTSPNIGPIMIVSEAENGSPGDVTTPGEEVPEHSLFVEPNNAIPPNIFAAKEMEQSGKKKGKSRKPRPL